MTDIDTHQRVRRLSSRAPVKIWPMQSGGFVVLMDERGRELARIRPEDMVQFAHDGTRVARAIGYG